MTEVPLFDELEAKVRRLVEEANLLRERQDKSVSGSNSDTPEKLRLIEEKVSNIIKLLEQL